MEPNNKPQSAQNYHDRKKKVAIPVNLLTDNELLVEHANANYIQDFGPINYDYDSDGMTIHREILQTDYTIEELNEEIDKRGLSIN